LHGRKASHFVHCRRYGVRTLNWSRPQLAGLVPLRGKASVSNISVSLGFVVPRTLAMASLSVVASPFAILPPPPSRFCSLVLYYYTPLLGWHPTAPYRLTPYCCSLVGIPSVRWLRSRFYPPRSSHSSSVTPSRGIALPPWLPPTPWIHRCNYWRDLCLRFCVSPQVQWFSHMRGQIIPFGKPCKALTEAIFSFVLGEPAEGFGSLSSRSLSIVSLHV